MPLYCCVPQCKSLSSKHECKFHKFPRDDKLRKLWTIAIKSGKKPSKTSVVCSKHFKNSDYFRSLSGLNEVLHKTAIPSENLPRTSHERPAPKRRVRDLEKNRSTNPDPENIIQIGETNDAETETPQGEDATLITKNKNKSTQTNKPGLMLHSEMLICNISNSETKYFTGFEKSRFDLLFFAINIISTPYDAYLDSKNQLALTLDKYRRGIDYLLITKLYNLPRHIVSEIFVCWTKFIYAYMKKINFWELRYKHANKYTAIIDCTEINTERSTLDPNINQELFSNYKNHNTFKYLVGIDEKGLIIFCSDVYGGSKSDRFIIENSQFLDLLTPGDILLADRGFNVSDLLEDKNVALNLPPFKTAPQFQPEEVMETRILANRRIHVERVINLTKKNKILSSTITASLWPIINEIVYNANMLCNFKDRVI